MARIAEIQADKRAGATYKDLQDKYGLAAGSIRNALKAKAKPPAKAEAKAATPAAPESPEPPTQEDVRRWLGEQVHALRADAGRLRGEGDAPALAAVNRSLVAASALLARVTPAPPPTENQGYYVTHESMAASAENVRVRWKKLVTSVNEVRQTWPKCPTCSKPQKPAYDPNARWNLEDDSPAAQLANELLEALS